MVESKIILTQTQIQDFQRKIWDYYKSNKRDFAWRQDITPYRVFVSEVMLQQTQTVRVMPKFEQWMQRFDSFQAVATASQHDILKAWQGLGYNRRGLALYNASKMIVDQWAGVLPDKSELLMLLPGIGPNTAGSVTAFAFNKPVVFIETNIRTIFLHEFFKDQNSVDDKAILELVRQTLDNAHVREWYYALMDYGVYLKTQLKLNNKTSKHYARQSTFIGSRRQVRGSIVRILTRYKQLPYQDLIELVYQDISGTTHDIDRILRQLLAEGFVSMQDDLVVM